MTPAAVSGLVITGALGMTVTVTEPAVLVPPVIVMPFGSEKIVAEAARGNVPAGAVGAIGVGDGPGDRQRSIGADGVQ